MIATDAHPFWVAGNINKWTKAAQLKPGMWLRTSAGTYVQITATKSWTSPRQRVHNLTVADIHTYHVQAGTVPVLVHNSGPEDCNAGRALWQLTKEGSSAMKRGGPFKTAFYKSSSDGTWWTPDMAGHGGSSFKVYKETKKGLQWVADADQYGDYISGKWKGSTGFFHSLVKLARCWMTIRSVDEFLRLRFSENPADYRRAASEEAPLQVWQDIVCSHPEARFWVAQNKTAPLEILETLAVDPEARVRHAVAMKRKLTPEILARLASDDDESIRMRVAMHRNTAIETLEKLRDDPWERVREIVNKRLSP